MTFGAEKENGLNTFGTICTDPQKKIKFTCFRERESSLKSEISKANLRIFNESVIHPIWAILRVNITWAQIKWESQNELRWKFLRMWEFHIVCKISQLWCRLTVEPKMDLLHDAPHAGSSLVSPTWNWNEALWAEGEGGGGREAKKIKEQPGHGIQ